MNCESYTKFHLKINEISLVLSVSYKHKYFSFRYHIAKSVCTYLGVLRFKNFSFAWVVIILCYFCLSLLVSYSETFGCGIHKHLSAFFNASRCEVHRIKSSLLIFPIKDFQCIFILRLHVWFFLHLFYSIQLLCIEWHTLYSFVYDLWCGKVVSSILLCRNIWALFGVVLVDYSQWNNMVACLT